MKFKGELLVDEKFEKLLNAHLDTIEKKQSFLKKALNKSIDAIYPDNVFDVEIEVTE